ncbi:MAG TPA: SRPBCC family protein [Actinotalea sp.]|nr:SRPBCC family protein [Actinotalea sp.]
MPTVEQSIDVHVPIRTAYDQWTQFESFPRFMGGVDSVEQIDDTHTRWRTTVGGVDRDFDAEITEQHPEERVAWRSTDGTTHAGVVTFHKIDDGTTRLMVQLDWAAENVTEKVGAALGIDDRQVKKDLERFKELIESQGFAEGGWRGDVPRD